MKKILKHLFPGFFFSLTEKKMILNAIREAESKTSGEIRVHLERHSGSDTLEHTQKVFHKIGMTQTRQRNGVLIYLAIRHKKFAVLGDEAIHQKVGNDFWTKTAAILGDHFSRDRFAEGVCAAIEEIGHQLKAHFPHEKQDINELPDELSL